MPFSKEALGTTFNLSMEDVDQTLAACQLPIDQPEYSDEDIANRFEKIRSYLNEGQADNYDAAMELLKQESQTNGKRKKSGRSKSKSNQDGSDSGSTAMGRAQILGEIQALAKKAGGLTAEEFVEILPDLAEQRVAELTGLFDQGMLSTLHEYAESGTLEQMVRQGAAGKKSLHEIPSLFLEAEVIEEQPPSSPPLLNESSNNK